MIATMTAEHLHIIIFAAILYIMSFAALYYKDGPAFVGWFIATVLFSKMYGAEIMSAFVK